MMKIQVIGTFIIILLNIKPVFANEYKEYKYKIVWKGITVGYAHLGKYGIIDYHGERCYILQTHAYNTPFLQNFYPVNDRFISYWSVDKKIPYYSEKQIREGRYFRYQKSFFHHEQKKILWNQKEFSGNIKNRENKWKIKHGEIEFNLPPQDILSAIFFNKEAEKEPFVNAQFFIPLFDDTKLTELKIHIQALEEIDVHLNHQNIKKRAWKIKPYYETSGLFRLAGDLTLWVSDDLDRSILKMQAKIPYLGIIITELIEIKLL